MKTEQVIEGIGKAVAATQPAQEYCLFWWDWWPMCMTKAEWSGWMQFVGTVAAILGAFLLAHVQEKIKTKQARISAASKVMVFVANVSACVHTLSEIEEIDKFQIRRQQAIIREHLSVGLAIPAELLSDQWYKAFEASRLIAAQLIVFYEMLDNGYDNFAQILISVTVFRNFFEEIDSVMRTDYLDVKFSR